MISPRRLAVAAALAGAVLLAQPVAATAANFPPTHKPASRSATPVAPAPAPSSVATPDPAPAPSAPATTVAPSPTSTAPAAAAPSGTVVQAAALPAELVGRRILTAATSHLGAASSLAL